MNIKTPTENQITKVSRTKKKHTEINIIRNPKDRNLELRTKLISCNQKLEQITKTLIIKEYTQRTNKDQQVN